MGIIRDLGYRVPSPNRAQRAVWTLSASRPGSWLFARSLHHVDKALLAASRGRVTSAGLLAGIPVLTITTIGARTNVPRTVPLLGVPYAGYEAYAWRITGRKVRIIVLSTAVD